MTTTEAPIETNGVPTTKMFGTIAKLREHGELAALRFFARNERIEGTASASTIHEWYGVGTDHVHVDPTSVSVTRRSSTDGEGGPS